MKKIRVFEAFAGYGSTAIAMKLLQKHFPNDVEFEFVGISEIEPNAITAYKALHGDVVNYGDICNIDWGGGKCQTLTSLHIAFLVRIYPMQESKKVLRKVVEAEALCYGNVRKR